MTQNTIHCNGKGLPDYPIKVNLLDINVYIHDSGMIATHNYPCPICRNKSAILDLNTGIMQPCDQCQTKGYIIIIKNKNWFEKFLTFNFLTSRRPQQI